MQNSSLIRLRPTHSLRLASPLLTRAEKAGVSDTGLDAQGTEAEREVAGCSKQGMLLCRMHTFRLLGSPLHVSTLLWRDVCSHCQHGRACNSYADRRHDCARAGRASLLTCLVYVVLPATEVYKPPVQATLKRPCLPSCCAGSWRCRGHC